MNIYAQAAGGAYRGRISKQAGAFWVHTFVLVWPRIQFNHTETKTCSLCIHKLILVHFMRILRQHSRRGVCANTLSANRYRRFQLPLEYTIDKMLISQNSAFCMERPLLAYEKRNTVWRRLAIFCGFFFQFANFGLSARGYPGYDLPYQGTLGVFAVAFDKNKVVKCLTIDKNGHMWEIF